MNIKSTKGLHADRIKCLVYGASGSGKTSLIGTLPEDETLIISAESGLLSLADKSIDVLEVKTFDDVIEAFKFLKTEEAAKYKNIAIDSLTEISSMLVTSLEKNPTYQEPKMALKMWGEYSNRMTALVKAFRDLDRNVIFTALPESVNDGGMIIKRPFIAGSKVQGLLVSFFDECFYLHVDSDGNRTLQTQPDNSVEAKDRSGKLDNPETPDLTVVFNKIRNKGTEQ